MRCPLDGVLADVSSDGSAEAVVVVVSVVVSVVSVVASELCADSLDGSIICTTPFPAPAERAAPAKKSVANARLAAILLGATRTFFRRSRAVSTSCLRSLRTRVLRSESAAERKSTWARLFPVLCVPCGICLLRSLFSSAEGRHIGADL